jgi:flagellar protein FlgJ
MDVPVISKAVAAAEIAPERLANTTALTESQKIAEASRQFEAILLRQILATSQKPVIASKFTDNSTASEIYRDMVTTQLADSISKSGAFGLASTFEHQLKRPENLHSKPGPAALAGNPSSSTAKTDLASAFRPLVKNCNHAP